jgi:DNA-binding MarR family transcriptional regulator
MLNNLSAHEQQILKVLLENPYISTRQVARKAGISWNTTKKYLDRFREMKWVEHKRGKSKDFWKAYPPHEEVSHHQPVP